MKRVVGALFMFWLGWYPAQASAQSANSPPTAQFPATDPVPPAPPPPPAPPAPAAPTNSAPAQPAPNATATPQVRSIGAPPPGYAVYPYPAVYPELTPARPTDSDELFSLTISPLHLIFPIVQLTGELRVAPHLGISLIAGYGTIDSTTIDSSAADYRFKTYELGGRVVGYPLKQFKSLEFGGQVMYVKINTDGPIDGNGLSGTAAGTAFGPFAGYKLVTSGGFTFLAQLGVQYLAAQAEAHDNSGASDSKQNNRFGPLLNLDVGWSF